MHCVALRAGHIVDGRRQIDPSGRPLAELDHCRGGWVCRGDLARAVVGAVEADAAGYSAYHVVGARMGSERFGTDRAESALKRFHNLLCSRATPKWSCETAS